MLFGAGRSMVESERRDEPRDVDIFFCGNIHPAIHLHRMPYLARLAALHGRWNVVIRGGSLVSQTTQQQIEQVRRLPHAPEIEYLATELYRSCDCVVLPYRG